MAHVVVGVDDVLELFRCAEACGIGEVGLEVFECEGAVGVGGDAAEACVVMGAFQEVAGFARGHAHLFGVGSLSGCELFGDGDGGGDCNGVIRLWCAEDGVGLWGVARCAFEGLDGLSGVASEVVVVDAVGFCSAGGLQDGGAEAAQFGGCLGELCLEGLGLDVGVPCVEGSGGGVCGWRGVEHVPSKAAGGEL